MLIGSVNALFVEKNLKQVRQTLIVENIVVATIREIVQEVELLPYLREWSLAI